MVHKEEETGPTKVMRTQEFEAKISALRHTIANETICRLLNMQGENAELFDILNTLEMIISGTIANTVYHEQFELALNTIFREAAGHLESLQQMIDDGSMIPPPLQEERLQ